MITSVGRGYPNFNPTFNRSKKYVYNELHAKSDFELASVLADY
jgi:hypothetical protein